MREYHQVVLEKGIAWWYIDIRKREIGWGYSTCEFVHFSIVLLLKGLMSTSASSWQLFLIFKNFITKFDKGDNEYSSLNEVRICNNHYSTPPFLTDWRIATEPN